jgi:hypothetical protein
MTDLASDGYSLQGLTTFSTFTPGFTYTDSATGIEFEDFGNLHDLTVSGGVLSTPTSDDSILITIPDTILAIYLTIDVTAGLCDNSCPEGETSGILAFINTGSPTASWTVGISPINGTGKVEILNFNAAMAGDTGGDGGGSETPEVATFVLIGFGLIAMRWMHRLPRRFLPRRLQPA